MPGQGRGKLLDLHLCLLMRAPECLHGHGHGDEDHAGPPALLRLSIISKGSSAFSNHLVAYRAGNLTLVGFSQNRQMGGPICLFWDVAEL